MIIRCLLLVIVPLQQLLQRTSPKLFAQNLAGLIIICPSLIIVQMVSVCSISRSHSLKIDFDMKTLKIFFSKTTSLMALIFGM